MIKNFLNPKGHQNIISGSKVTAILLNGWIWPIGGVAAGRVAPEACAAGLFLQIYDINIKIGKFINLFKCFKKIFPFGRKQDILVNCMYYKKCIYNKFHLISSLVSNFTVIWWPLPLLLTL